MKKVLSVCFSVVLMAATQMSFAQSASSVAKMTGQMVDLEQQGATRTTPSWNHLLQRYNFGAASALGEIRPAPGLTGYSITNTMYGADSDVFPSAFVVYKGDAIVALFGVDTRPSESVTGNTMYPVYYTKDGKGLPLDEKRRLETWFYSWLESVN